MPRILMGLLGNFFEKLWRMNEIRAEHISQTVHSTATLGVSSSPQHSTNIACTEIDGSYSVHINQTYNCKSDQNKIVSKERASERDLTFYRNLFKCILRALTHTHSHMLKQRAQHKNDSILGNCDLWFG